MQASQSILIVNNYYSLIENEDDGIEEWLKEQTGGGNFQTFLNPQDSTTPIEEAIRFGVASLDFENRKKK